MARRTLASSTNGVLFKAASRSEWLARSPMRRKIPREWVCSRLMAASVNRGRPTPAPASEWVMYLAVCVRRQIILAWGARHFYEVRHDTPSLYCLTRGFEMAGPVTGPEIIETAT